MRRDSPDSAMSQTGDDQTPDEMIAVHSEKTIVASADETENPSICYDQRSSGNGEAVSVNETEEDMSSGAETMDGQSTGNGDTAPGSVGTESCANLSVTTEMSKSQRKKAEKRKKWLETRQEMRLRERENKKRKRAENKEKGILPPPRAKYVSKSMAESSCKIRVAIDMDFDEFMVDGDIRKCYKQIQSVYAVNRRASDPLQFYVVNFRGRSREIFDETQGTSNWDVHLRKEDYLETFGKENVVYLTSDSEAVLDKLSPDEAYIIGGIVDHNHHKGLCFRRALEKGVRTARLPIDEFVEMKTRKVLTINHVFEILLKAASGSGWKEAFFSVIPGRKGVSEKCE